MPRIKPRTPSTVPAAIQNICRRESDKQHLTTHTMSPPDTAPPGEVMFIRLPAVRAKVALSRSQIYSLIAAGTFPRPVKLGARASGWLNEEVNRWISEQIPFEEYTASP